MKKVYLRRRDVQEMFDLSDWIFLKWLHDGVLQPYGFTRQGRAAKIVPWDELTEQEQQKQRRLYRALDVEKLVPKEER
jgi:hypothetical protein